MVIVELDDDRALLLGQPALSVSICPCRHTMVVSSATFVAIIDQTRRTVTVLLFPILVLLLVDEGGRVNAGRCDSSV